ncbi:Mov34/MPN/PAD-1 family protein [Formosa undariae]|uniref:Mov34/MPN/PAD-1 family protein n=1 Tax=Formosa undariae TaxID=1325436 RepID=A0ABV5F278_9FLAO
MTYSNDDKNVIFEESCINIFKHYTQTGKKFEKGGILLGRCTDENTVVIEKASIPTLFDRSSRYNFQRDKRSAQIFIDYEFIASQGKTIYIGEWHTHPEDLPTPSTTDVQMIKRQFKKNKINETFLFMVIVGRKKNYVGYYDGKKLIEFHLSTE